MLDAFEARLKPHQTFEERQMAYLDPQLETKRLENFQKMIEGTQAFLQKQMDIRGSLGDHQTQQQESRQEPSGREHVVTTNEPKIEGPQQTKHRRRRRRSSRAASKLPSSMPIPSSTVLEIELPKSKMQMEHTKK